jgi:3-hydroxyisobutyrate dehydrogenase-like beta-hydroxyacid dehydrogenase
MTSLALIGFGEVGQAFAKGLLANEGVRVAAHDLVFADPRLRDSRTALAQAIGVRVATDAADAARGAIVVISAVTAAAALDVAKAAAGYLAPKQLFLDVNSASPSTKRAAAKHVEAAGAHYVEGAVMAGVAAHGLEVPILAGGPAAKAAADRLNALGMDITAVATEHGRASAMKLCRSIVMKGLDAILLESAAAARRWDVETEVLASLQETHPGIDWAKVTANCAKRVGQHGRRRAAEMREAAQMLDELGLDSGLSLAIAGVQERSAKP